MVGQDIMNQDVGGYFQGLYITSGFFQMWRASGLLNMVNLKYATLAAGFGTVLSIGGSYAAMHINFQTIHFYRKFKTRWRQTCRETKR